MKWTHDKPTKPGLYLVADSPRITPRLYSVRETDTEELVLVDEPSGYDSGDDLGKLDPSHLWFGPIHRPECRCPDCGPCAVDFKD